MANSFERAGGGGTYATAPDGGGPRPGSVPVVVAERVWAPPDTGSLQPADATTRGPHRQEPERRARRAAPVGAGIGRANREAGAVLGRDPFRAATALAEVWRRGDGRLPWSASYVPRPSTRIQRLASGHSMGGGAWRDQVRPRIRPAARHGDEAEIAGLRRIVSSSPEPLGASRVAHRFPSGRGGDTRDGP